MPRTRRLARVAHDAGVQVTPGADLVVALDTLVAAVHFPADTLPFDRGYKSVAVNLSDLAAMGARPLAAIGYVALDDPGPDELERVTEGMRAALAPYAARLLDTIGSSGAVAVTVQAFGEVPHGQAIRRDGARAGDGIYVTGTLGDAGLALSEHYREVVLDESAHTHSWSRLNRPQARVAIGEKLRTIASASIDLSDGLTSDLGHLTRASKVRARVDLSRLPISAGLQRTFEPMRAWRCAATSGDDYELCFTVPRAAEDRLASEAAAFECAVTRIGVIEHGEGVCCMAPDGEAIDLGRGYEHFVPR